MSIVTNIILNVISLDFGEDAKLKEINSYLEQRGYKPLVSLDDDSLPKGWYGGNKFLEADLYCGAFNKLNLDEFILHITSLSWEGPSLVQAMVQEQDDLGFRIIEIINKNWEQA